MEGVAVVTGGRWREEEDGKERWGVGVEKKKFERLPCIGGTLVGALMEDTWQWRREK